MFPRFPQVSYSQSTQSVMSPHFSGNDSAILSDSEDSASSVNSFIAGVPKESQTWHRTSSFTSGLPLDLSNSSKKSKQELYLDRMSSYLGVPLPSTDEWNSSDGASESPSSESLKSDGSLFTSSRMPKDDIKIRSRSNMLNECKKFDWWKEPFSQYIGQSQNPHNFFSENSFPKEFSERKAKEYIFKQCVENNDFEGARRILEKSDSKTQKKLFKLYPKPLERAIGRGHIETAEVLLQNGDSANHTNLYNGSPSLLTAAVKHPQKAKELVTLLLKYNARTDQHFRDKLPEEYAQSSEIKDILVSARKEQMFLKEAELIKAQKEIKKSRFKRRERKAQVANLIEQNAHIDRELQESQQENQQRRDRSTERNKELESSNRTILHLDNELNTSQTVEQVMQMRLRRAEEKLKSAKIVQLKEKYGRLWKQLTTSRQKDRLAGDLTNTQGELNTAQQNLTTIQTELSAVNIARLNAEKKHEDLYQKWVKGLETDRDEAQARANRLQEELMQKRIQEAVRTERALGRAGTVATFADQTQVRTFSQDPVEASSSQTRPRTPYVNNSSQSFLAGEPLAPEPLRIRRPTRSVSSQSSFGDISLAPDRPEESRIEGSLADDSDAMSQAFSDASTIHSTFGRRSSIGSAAERAANWVRNQIHPQDSSEDEGSVDSKERRPRFKRTARRYRKGESRTNLPRSSSALHPGFPRPTFDTESLTGSESDGGVDFDSEGLKKHYEENVIAGQHPLLDAFYAGKRDKVQRILGRNPEALKQTNKAGETVLHWAALMDNPGAANYFLNIAGRNATQWANQKTFDGRDALMMTASQNSAETAKALLNHPQAKVDWAATHSTANSTNDETALHIATRMGHSKVARIIVPRVDKTTLNAFCRQHRTPGMNAAENGLHRTIGAMLDHPEFDPSLQSADSQDAAAFAARYGHKTARAKKGRNQQGKWQTFNRFVKGMGEGKNITFNARDYSPNHDFWQQLSALGYAAISAPPKTFSRALAHKDSNPNQSLFRRINGQHGFQTLVGLTAQYGRSDNLQELAKIPGIKLRLKTEHSGNDALKIATEHNQAGMIEPINTAITEKTGRPLTLEQILKPNRDRKTVVKIGYENAALETIAALKRTFPDLDTRPTRSDLQAAKKKLPRKKYRAMKMALRRVSR